MPTKEDINHYMNGQCGAFAVALHAIFGYIVHYAEFDDNGNGNICHFYCVQGDKLIDVRGVISPPDLQANSPPLDDWEINDWLRPSISESEINRAVDIIETNREMYTV